MFAKETKISGKNHSAQRRYKSRTREDCGFNPTYVLPPGVHHVATAHSAFDDAVKYRSLGQVMPLFTLLVTPVTYHMRNFNIFQCKSYVC